MNVPVDIERMILVENIHDDDPAEMALLVQRADEASEFLKSFRWCKRIRRSWFAGGFSHVAVFFFEIDNSQDVRDSFLWVLVGDIPPAYLVVDVIPDYKEALLVYVYEMRKWIAAVKKRQSTKACIPVNVPATLENAAELERRLDFIEKEYVPSLS